jgi:hypothetical protein
VVETPDAQLLKPLRFSFSVALADSADHLTLRQLENLATGTALHLSTANAAHARSSP